MAEQVQRLYGVSNGSGQAGGRLAALTPGK